MNRMNWSKFLITLLLTSFSLLSYGQLVTIKGEVSAADGTPLAFAAIALEGTTWGTSTNENGQYELVNVAIGEYVLQVSFLGYETKRQSIDLSGMTDLTLNFALQEMPNMMEEVVVTGTLKEVNRLESPVPVDVYRPTFFKKNPTPNIYEALQNVNGVRPQLNCQVCNTGDIHINGLEGPYTMVLIDGLPIVSSLATVYGLSGIPNSLVERMEIVKGPASSLYGSEAIGGLINIITKSPHQAPVLSIDVIGNSWSEWNVDLGIKNKLGKAASLLTGFNYFNYSNPIDRNKRPFYRCNAPRTMVCISEMAISSKGQPFVYAGRKVFLGRPLGGRNGLDARI